MAILTFSFIYSNTISRGKTEEREKWHQNLFHQRYWLYAKMGKLRCVIHMFIILKGRKHFGVNKKPPNFHFFSKLPKKEKGKGRNK